MAPTLYGGCTQLLPSTWALMAVVLSAMLWDLLRPHCYVPPAISPACPCGPLAGCHRAGTLEAACWLRHREGLDLRCQVLTLLPAPEGATSTRSLALGLGPEEPYPTAMQGPGAHPVLWPESSADCCVFACCWHPMHLLLPKMSHGVALAAALHPRCSCILVVTLLYLPDGEAAGGFHLLGSWSASGWVLNA